MNEIIETKENQRAPGLITILLHLIPGVLLTLVFLAMGWFAGDRWPPTLIFLASVSLTLVPWQAAIVWRKRRELASKPAERPSRPGRVILFLIMLGSLVWAAASFVLLDSIVTKPLGALVQPHLPDWFALGRYAHTPNAFARDTRIFIWACMLVFTLIVPALEELYFRGILMRRLDSLGWAAPMWSAFLFAAYHVWSLWMLPVRFVATLPYIWFSWRYRSVWIAILVHVSLNLIGDVILIAPVVFG